MSQRYQVAAYYFPSYHPDPVNEKRHGQGWTEWALVKAATPRFPGHLQPRVPLWGYEDESLAPVMEKKINAAVEHGVNAFIFDWYWYAGGPYLQAALEKGYLEAPSVSRHSFALMWANHDWVDIHPAARHQPYALLDRGDVAPEVFRRATDHVIQRYFSHPRYWRVDGGLYFSFYDLGKLIASHGGESGAAAALSDFRARVRAAGLGELHLNAVLWNEILLPGETPEGRPEGFSRELGFDSVSHYVWLHHQPMRSFPSTPYAVYRDGAVRDWRRFAATHSLPYIPNVTVGWDSSPRTIATDGYDPLGYPFLPVLSGSTPAQFTAALRGVKQFLDETGRSVFTINAWNEWTEGSFLEPDTLYGMGHLHAIREVFGA